MLKLISSMILGNFGTWGTCSTSNLCGEDEGDCDHDGQCREGHMCGIDNCRSSLGFESFYDCCYSVEEDFCTIDSPCGENMGDCDSNDVCQGNLVCGLNNCPVSLDYDSEVDCCYKLLVGNEDFCTINHPCGINEGDCDLDGECQKGLICITANDCSSNFGLNYPVDCCQEGMYKRVCNSIIEL